METAETSHHLGDLQLAIMRVLWNHDEATVAEVHEALEPERGLALTTIATMLTKMEKKGVVEHRAEGRRGIVCAAPESACAGCGADGWWRPRARRVGPSRRS